MITATSYIVLHPAVTVHDIAEILSRRGDSITESDRMLDGQHLYQVEHEVGLWTLDELKKHFLH